MSTQLVRHTVHAARLLTLAGALAAASAHAAPAPQELAEIRAQISQMKHDYEARLQALEQRLQEAQAQLQQQAAARAAPAVAAGDAAPAAPAADGTLAPASVAAELPAAPPAAQSNPNAFNPAIALILGGTYARLSQDPAQYRLQGFVPAGSGPGPRSFALGESELTLSANIDPQFAGTLTFSLDGQNSASVEEAFVQTLGLSGGVNLKAGRFLSALGYLNSQHAHAWDFVDAPLVYQAFLGGQYKTDGVQAKWLLPTERFAEVGLELGNGAAFPGNDRNKNGLGAVLAFAHVGDDLGESASWRAGLSYLRTASDARAFASVDGSGAPVLDSVDARSTLWIADAIYKWAPNGNPVNTNVKLQGEYFHRRETGQFGFDTQGAHALGGPYASSQSGWYLQGLWQFMPAWRAGLRYDRLHAGTPLLGAAGLANVPWLAPYDPARASVMLDYTPSEFSRVRLQFARDRARPGAPDNQLYLQYVMSLGAHGAHTF